MIEITLDEVYDVFMQMDMREDFGGYCDFLKQFGFVII